MKKMTILVLVMLILAGCSEEYVSSESQLFSELSEEDMPELGVARDMLAAALSYQIDLFVEKNRPEMKVCFLSILDLDPAEELLARLEGTKLEVHKFSEWATHFKNEQGLPYIPNNYITISVRDVRILDSDNAEVDTRWNVSGVSIPGETCTVKRFAGTWKVTGIRPSTQ